MRWIPLEHRTSTYASTCRLYLTKHTAAGPFAELVVDAGRSGADHRHDAQHRHNQSLPSALLFHLRPGPGRSRPVNISQLVAPAASSAESRPLLDPNPTDPERRDQPSLPTATAMTATVISAEACPELFRTKSVRRLTE